jgi:hypothetical protein
MTHVGTEPHELMLMPKVVTTEPVPAEDLV